MNKYKIPECEMLLNDLQLDTIDERTYANDDIWCQIIRDVEEYNELMDHIEYLDHLPNCPLQQSESPDVIYTSMDTDYVMGIECFKTDASKKTSDGSTQIRMERETDRKISNRYRSGDYIIEEGKRFVSVKEPVNVHFSFEEYLKTLSDVFWEHASKIQRYRNNLKIKFPGKKIYLSFFIDDITAVGNYVEDRGKVESLIPIRIPQFVKLLQHIKGIDYVLIKTTNMYVPNVGIYNCDKENLDNLLLTCYSGEAKYISYEYEIEQHFYQLKSKGTR